MLNRPIGKDEESVADSELILDDSSMYNEGKLAKLASIDELIEYEEEISDMTENLDLKQTWHYDGLTLIINYSYQKQIYSS